MFYVYTKDYWQYELKVYTVGYILYILSTLFSYIHKKEYVSPSNRKRIDSVILQSVFNTWIPESLSFGFGVQYIII